MTTLAASRYRYQTPHEIKTPTRSPSTKPDERGGHAGHHERRGPALVRRTTLALTAAVVFLSLTAGRPLGTSAQEVRDPAGETGCDGPVIHEIFVDNHTIYPPVPDSGQSMNWPGRLANWLANRVHRRTRGSLIRDELLFEEGDCFDPFLVEESARILRALPFIADADVYSVAVSETEVHVVVDTRDKWTLKLDIRPEFDQRLRITRVSVTEENLMGTGTLLGVYLIERDERRDLGLELRTPRLAGTRMDGRIGAGRTRTGRFFHESLTYPFVGEVGHWAFVEFFSHREDLFRYVAPADSVLTHVNLPMRATRAATMLARRFGTPGDLTVVGAGFSWEDVSFDDYPDGVTVVSGFDFSNPDTADAVTAEVLLPHVNRRRTARLDLMAGKRNIGFVTRRGLDALRSEQDIRVGTQALLTVATTLGSPTWASEGDYHELRGWVSLFGGAAGDNWVFNSELTIEAARHIGRAEGGMRDVLAEAGAYFYWQPGRRGATVDTAPASRHTLVLGLKGAGGWDTSLPFQLTLGGPSGVRGYSREDLPAGRKLVAHMEDRIVLGTLPGLFDVGLTLFADVGAGWHGGVPFGADTGLRGAVGAGLRIALPPGARQVVRVDLAVPLHAGGLADYRFRIGYDPVSLLTGFGDQQARRSRSASAARAIFGNR
ncbi:MAG: BamA/TamA family outer membrane protein [Gemmatimonadota bacterium]|nr:BamA/TamA family outer membrane protein [Gemmatimonadota bacterium]